MPGSRSSINLVDPALRPLLDLNPTRTIDPDDFPGLPLGLWEMSPIPNEGVTLEKLSIPGLAGDPDVPILIYRPPGMKELLPCIFHIHGGGYIMGAAEDLEFMHRPLVAATGCVLISVNYRLAPETRFPGALRDCYSGLAWVFDHASELGIAPNRVGVMGESAGGGLAAALALFARDQGVYKLAFQHLIYPMIDDRTCVSATPHPYTGEFVWTAASNHIGWSALLGDVPGGDHVSPYAAAARAADLSHLPPTYMSVGALDLFLEENLDYARRLTRAGVALELHVYPGAFHGFELVTSAAVAEASLRDSRAALYSFCHRGE